MRSWDEIMHDPRIDESGDYDYYAVDLPQNEMYWAKNSESRCDYCGKYHRINHVSTCYFYTLDGYDSMSDTECIWCVAKDKAYSIRKKTIGKAKKELSVIKFMGIKRYVKANPQYKEIIRKAQK